MSLHVPRREAPTPHGRCLAMLGRSPFALALLATALVQVALAGPARACNEWNFEQRVAAVAPDGAIILVVTSYGGGVRDKVAVLGPDGREVARCTSEESEAWTCVGARRFRARGTERPRTIVARWSKALGATPAPPPVAIAEAPTGAVAAMLSCRRRLPRRLAVRL